ncbi:hypothetical protein TSMEX_009850 [Taenia solium]|eukprot:TsM_000884200 transcript=TsM_000884200 gene=TsM_000884200
MEKEAKGKIVGAVENEVIKLHAVVGKVLGAATAKVKVADVAGFEILDGLVRRITSFSSEVGKAKDVYTSIEGKKIDQHWGGASPTTPKNLPMRQWRPKEEAEAMPVLTEYQHFIESSPVQVKPYKLKTNKSWSSPHLPSMLALFSN